MEPKQGTVLRLQGELDEDGCAEVRRQLAPAVTHGLRHLVIDLSEVSEVSLAGVQMLRSLDRHLRGQQGGLLLLHASDEVRRTLRVNELEGLLEVRDLEAPKVRRTPARKHHEELAGVIPLVRRA
jgi:anti-sigma B factor antagonist